MKDGAPVLHVTKTERHHDRDNASPPTQLQKAAMVDQVNESFRRYTLEESYTINKLDTWMCVHQLLVIKFSGPSLTDCLYL